MTTSGAARPASRTPKLASRNFGSQNRKKSHTGSVSALPTMKAQVWRRPSNARHGVFSIDSIGARFGARYSANQRASHTRSSAPVARNAQRHPSPSAIAGTSSAATSTPTWRPAFKMPVAAPNSRATTVQRCPNRGSDTARHAEAAVHRDDGAGHERRRVAAQPLHRADDLLGSAEPAHRRVGDDGAGSLRVAAIRLEKH